MANPPDPRDEIIDSLDQLAGGVSPPQSGAAGGSSKPVVRHGDGVSAPPAKKRTIPTAIPAGDRPQKHDKFDAPVAGNGRSARKNADWSPERAFRCLYCGYPLMEESGLRCTECGREYKRHVLERWFWGEEESRLERVLWLVRACVFLKLWILPDVAVFTGIASAAAAGWGCWIAGQGKQKTIAWNWAVAGMVAAGLIVVASLFARAGLSPATQGALEAVCACLLLITMLRDADGQPLWREPTGSRIAMGMLFVAPLLGTLMALAPRALGALSAGGTGLSALTERTWVLWAVEAGLPQIFALGTWIFVWRWLAWMRRGLFGNRGDLPERPEHD